MSEIFPILSTPVSVDVDNIDNEEVEAIKREQYADYPKRLDGACTVDHQILEKYPNLKRVCIGHVETLVHDVLAVSEQAGIKIVCSWVNKHPPNHSANRHGHTNSMFTGCLYLDIPKNSGNLIFEASYNHCTWCTGTVEPIVYEDNILNSRIWQIEPQAGMCVAFPSHVDHYTGVNESTQDRYSLGFNVMMVGDFSAPTRHLKLSC